MYEPTDETKEFAERDQLIKSLLALKGELIGQMNNHNLGVSTQEMLYKLNSCLYSKYPHVVKKF